MIIYEHNLENRYALLGNVEKNKVYTVSFRINGKSNFRIDIVDEKYNLISPVVKTVNGIATRYNYTIRAKVNGNLGLYIATEAASNPAAWTEITNLTMEAQGNE